MRTTNNTGWAALLAALAILVTAGEALAATPYKNRFYRGSTSQEGDVRLKVSPGASGSAL